MKFLCSFSVMLVSGALSAVAGGISAPSTAQVEGSGYISLRGARNRIAIPGASETITSYAIDGAVVFRPVGRYNIQLNGLYDRWNTDETFYDEDGDPVLTLDESDIFAGDAHLFWGRPNVYTVGAFASIFEYDVIELANETVFGGGLEADIYSDMWTTSVQAGLFMGEDDVEIYAGSGQARLYATPFFSLEGSVAYGTTEDDFAEGDAYGFGAEAEFQFEGTPVSVFGGAKYMSLDDLDVETRALMLGVRWNLGSRTLLERDRTGASMRGSQKIIELLER